MIWTEGLDHLKIFIDYLNNIHPTIEFTSSHSLTNVPFLDVMVSLNNGTIQTDLYTKPTDNHQHLLSSSCHPQHTKTSIPFSLALRIRRICSTNATLYDNKTNFILIGTRQQLSKVDVDSLCVGDSIVSQIKSAKNLGTWMDNNLNLKINVNNTCKAAYYHLTNVRRIRKYLDEKTTQTLIHALIIGRIDYCNSILYGLPAKELAKLQRLQNSAARIIFNIPRMCHITPVLRELHWLPVQFRIQFKLIIITFKVIKGQGPMYLQELVRLQQSGAYSLRSSNKGLMLQIPNVISKKTLGDRAYMCAAPKLWNSLPYHVRNENDFNKFKILLKTYLFNLAFN